MSAINENDLLSALRADDAERIEPEILLSTTISGLPAAIAAASLDAAAVIRRAAATVLDRLVHVVSPGGETLLHAAAESCALKALEALHESGAAARLCGRRDAFGETALFKLVQNVDLTDAAALRRALAPLQGEVGLLVDDEDGRKVTALYALLERVCDESLRPGAESLRVVSEFFAGEFGAGELSVAKLLSGRARDDVFNVLYGERDFAKLDI